MRDRVTVIFDKTIERVPRRSQADVREWKHAASEADLETMRLIVWEWDLMTRATDTKRHARFDMPSEAALERLLERVGATPEEG